jgi:hypothetical protein
MVDDEGRGKARYINQGGDGWKRSYHHVTKRSGVLLGRGDHTGVDPQPIHGVGQGAEAGEHAYYGERRGVAVRWRGRGWNQAGSTGVAGWTCARQERESERWRRGRGGLL